jgi:hypothetical protein
MTSAGSFLSMQPQPHGSGAARGSGSRWLARVALSVCAVASLATAARADDWSFTRIADDTAGFAPFAGGTPPSIAPDGTVAFLAALDAGPITLNVGAGAATTELLRTGAAFASVAGPPAQGALGDTFVLATPVGEPVGIYRASAGVAPSLVYGGAGLTLHTVPRVNDAGVVAFRANNLGQKIYKGNGGALTLVRQTGRLGITSLASRPAINTVGLVAQRETLSSGVEVIRSQLDVAAPSAIIASSGGDILRFFDVPDLNDAGVVVFAAELAGGGHTIRRGDGGPLDTLVNTGPHFSALGNPAIGPDGSVVFRGVLADGGGEGLFAGPDPLHQSVIRTGDFLDGSSVVSVSFDAVGANDAGQLAFLATLADGRSGVYRADPGGEPAETRVRRARDALAALSRTPIATHFENGLFRLFHGDVPVLAGTPAAQARRFVSENRDLLGWTSADLDLAPAQVTDFGPDGRLVRFAQRYKDTPVFGGGVNVALEPDGASRRVTSLVGALVPELPNLSVAPAFPPGPCIESARLALGDPAAVSTIEPKLFVFDGRLVGRGPGANPLGTHLVYRIHLLGETATGGFLVDAHTAQVVYRYGLEHEVHPNFDLTVRDGAMAHPLLSQCWKIDGPYVTLGDEQGVLAAQVPNLAAQALIQFANGTFDFFIAPPLLRCGHDGSCGEERMYVHAGVWNASYAPTCGTIQFRDEWLARDVLTHEFTHGVIEYSSGLLYEDESGALNESYADTMAWLEDFEDDLLGEDLPAGNGPVRSMADPASFGHPDTYSSYVPGGGVHTNSSITNKAHHLMGKGGRHNGFPHQAWPAIAGIGAAKMRPLIYQVMTSLPHYSTLQLAAVFSMYRAQTFGQTGDHGYTSADLCSVRNGFAAVELAIGDSDCDGTLDQWEDTDGDGISDAEDNCPTVWNASQASCDSPLLGNACAPDQDGDGVPDDCDNCPSTPDVGQQDQDGDGLGDACDGDWDNDGVSNPLDNCPFDHNTNQGDADGDGTGNACDVDPDDDGWLSFLDNCPVDANPDQQDGDGDGKGDVCDGCPTVYDPPLAYTSDEPPLPVEPDSDGDGTPDACDLNGQFGLASLLVGGIGYNPSLGVVPASGGRSSVDLSAPARATVRVPIPACPPDPVGPIAFTPSTRLQVVALGLDSGVQAALIGGADSRRSLLTSGGPDSRGAWLQPDCSRETSLELYTESFNGAEGFELDVSWVEATAAGNPFTQRPPSGVPSPPLPDADGDGLFDSIDTCPNAYDPTNADSGGIGAPDPDGIGDVCQCGDADDDGGGDVRDFAVVARFLGGLAPGVNTAKCDVAAPAGCGPEDLAALRAALAQIEPGIGQTCPAAI